jgi:hypothetical protein
MRRPNAFEKLLPGFDDLRCALPNSQPPSGFGSMTGAAW